MERDRRQIQVRHAAGAPEEVVATLKTERELEKLIAGEEKPDAAAVNAVVARIQLAMADYLESGKRLGIQLKSVEIVSALDAA